MKKKKIFLGVSDAFKNGFNARLEGMPLSANLYKYGPGFEGEESRNHASWIAGWTRAHEEEFGEGCSDL